MVDVAIHSSLRLTFEPPLVELGVPVNFKCSVVAEVPPTFRAIMLSKTRKIFINLKLYLFPNFLFFPYVILDLVDITRSPFRVNALLVLLIL